MNYGDIPGIFWGILARMARSLAPTIEFVTIRDLQTRRVRVMLAPFGAYRAENNGVGQMAHYVSIMDNWSNVEYVGPFDEQSARQYAAELNARTGFDTLVMDELELIENFAEYGPVNVSRPQ